MPCGEDNRTADELLFGHKNHTGERQKFAKAYSNALYIREFVYEQQEKVNRLTAMLCEMCDLAIESDFEIPHKTFDWLLKHRTEQDCTK